MKREARGLLDLARVPNTLTASADALAGALIMTGGAPAAEPVIRTMLASALLYAGGAALNDWNDVAADAVHRPDRPIPAGRVSRRGALVYAVVLLVSGFLFAGTVSTDTGYAALLVIAAIVGYDVVARPTPFAPVCMGLCRTFNLGMGMACVWTTWHVDLAIPLVVIFLYTAALTRFARAEAGRVTGWATVVPAAGMGVAVLVALGLYARGGALFGASVVLMATAIGFRAGVAVQAGRPDAVIRAVKWLVLVFPLITAMLTWPFAGFASAVLVAGFALPAALIARRFRVA